MEQPGQPASGVRGVPFAARLSELGGLAVIGDTGVTLTYAELAAAADEFAARLGPARCLLLIEATSTIEALTAYLGALRGGHAVILAAEGAAARDPRIARTYAPTVYADRGDGWRLEPGERHDLHPDLAVLLSTSGSTGTPKLVRLSAAAVDANARSIVEYLGIAPGERALTTLPLHYSYCLSVVNSHLSAGATLLLTGRSAIDPELWDFANRHGATSISGVPYSYELLDQIGYDTLPASLRTLTQAGGRLPPEAVLRHAAAARARGAEFFVMYGQTEATARMAYLPPARLAAHPDCIGIAIPGGSFELRGADGAVIDAAETPGELVYRGPNVMMGYAESAADLARGSELDELATGDIAVRNAAGLYRIVGRLSRFAKPFGLRISLDEVEAAVARHGAQGVAAGDDRLIAVESCDKVDPLRLAAALAADFKLAPALFHVSKVDGHPRLVSGKIDYPAVLAAAHAARQALRTGDPVGDAFALAFGDRALDPADSFAGLGGDSLTYVTVSLALEAALGELPKGWEAMSLAELRASGTAAPRRRWLRPIDSDILLRAAAIIAVIVNHASDFIVGGGAHVLLILAGYNLARFQRVRLLRGDVRPMVTGFATRIILPYYAILLVYLAWKHELNVPALLLAGNFAGQFRSFIEPYWFLEALFQIYLIVAALFLVPAVRRAAARSPWQFGLGLVGASLTARLIGPQLFDHAALAGRTPDTLFVLVALGWCVAFADTPARRLAMFAATLGLALLGVVGSEVLQWWAAPWPGSLAPAIWRTVAVALLLWVPRVPIPRVAHAGIATIAAASFYIYLTHGLPVHLLRTDYDLGRLVAAVLASVLLGVAIWLVSQRLAPRTA